MTLTEDNIQPNADLTDADLSDADLTRATLEDATVTEAQLEDWGRRRTVQHLLDVRQLHLTDFER